MLVVFQRRTGFLGSKLRAATPDEGVLAGPTQKRTRKPIASANTDPEPEPKSTLQLPKRKPAKKQTELGPPVVAPPILGQAEPTEDPNKPPIIAPPQASTLDALHAARQRAKDREGRDGKN